MKTIKNILEQAGKKLSRSTTPRLDTEVLLCHVLNQHRTYLFSHAEKMLSDKEYQHWQILLAKRQQQVPVAYLTGQKEFWGLMFDVNAHTLIPRPETELLVELVLQHVNREKPSLSCLDLGTGSGAIAIALAKENPHWEVTATDISVETLQVAKKNAQKNNSSHILFVQSNWFSAINKKFDIIFSNPPYVAENDINLLTEEIFHEPRCALVAKNNGLADLEKIIQQGQAYLKTEGYLLLEHGSDQGVAVRELFFRHGYERMATFQDLEKRERVTLGRVHG